VTISITVDFGRLCRFHQSCSEQRTIYIPHSSSNKLQH